MSFLQIFFKPNIEKLESSSDVRGLIKALGYFEASDAAKVRSDATEALGRFKDHRAVKPLIAVLKDENGDVRKAAADALEKIKPDWPASDEAGQQVPAFIAALNKLISQANNERKPR